jgi:hypothetical protein
MASKIFRNHNGDVQSVPASSQAVYREAGWVELTLVDGEYELAAKKPAAKKPAAKKPAAKKPAAKKPAAS